MKTYIQQEIELTVVLVCTCIQYNFMHMYYVFTNRDAHTHIYYNIELTNVIKHCNELANLNLLSYRCRLVL